MKSFSLLRTNPSLTTNIKIVVDGKYGLSLESFDSNREISSNRYKRFSITPENWWTDSLSRFWAETPETLAFGIRNDDSLETVYSEFSSQYDPLYWCGASRIEDDRFEEEYEFLAPLHIQKSHRPSNFVVLRVDNTFKNPNPLNTVGSLGKDDFRSELKNKWKFVKDFDLSSKTNLGIWLEKNFDDSDFPFCSMELNLENLQFTKLNGIDFKQGGWVKKSLFLNEFLKKDPPVFMLERFLTSSWESHGVVYPHILNFKFLFDDTPFSSKTLKPRKYTINRYLGFYVDEFVEAELVSEITLNTVSDYLLSPWIPPYSFKEGVFIKDSVFVDSLGNFINPFLGDQETGIDWIEYNNNFCQIKLDENGHWKVFSNSLISPGSSTSITGIFNNHIRVDFNTNRNSLLEYETRLVSFKKGLEYFSIKAFDESDFHLLEIGEHKVIIGNNTILPSNVSVYELQTDLVLNSKNKEISILKENGIEEKISTSGTSEINSPLEIKISRAKFTEICDWDFDRVETDFAKYDYEIENELPFTHEPKLFNTNPLDTSDRPEKESFSVSIVSPSLILNEDLIPLSSEYSLTEELFELDQGSLSRIWDKNQGTCKWGFKGSLGNQNEPYRLIFSGKEFGRNPREPDVFVSQPSPYLKNLEWFFWDNFDSGNLVGGYSPIKTFDKWSNYSLHIPNKFSESLYINSSDDYFQEYFSQTAYFNNQALPGQPRNWKKSFRVNRWAEFGGGTVSNPSTTIFKGLKLNLYEIDYINHTPNTAIENLVLKKSNSTDGWKISAISVVDSPASPTAVPLFKVYFNEDFKNVLVVVYLPVIVPTQNSDFYRDENWIVSQAYESGLAGYGGSELFTLNSFYNSLWEVDKSPGDYIQKLPVEFYVIKDSTISGAYSLANGFRGLGYWIEPEQPQRTEIEPGTFEVVNVQGPDITINPGNLIQVNTTHVQGIEFLKSQEPLSREIVEEDRNFIQENYNSNSAPQSSFIFRYSGYYEPIFKSVNIWRDNINSLYLKGSGNYKFADNLTEFGISREVIFNKINRKNSPLKTADNENYTAVYPRIDETGFDFGRKFVFKSNWDGKFFTEHSL